MARTKLFRMLQRSMTVAHLKNTYPNEGSRIDDIQALLKEGSNLERRRFLKSALALGIASLPLSALIRSAYAGPRNWKSIPPHGYDTLRNAAQRGVASTSKPITIIGGGLGGLTTAYRLMKAGIACEVFEGSPRLGGRVFTKDGFNSEGMFCELGGELIDSPHQDLIGLAQELGVAVDSFLKIDQSLQHESFYFNGRNLYEKDLIAVFAPLASKMAKDIAAIFPDPNNFVVDYRSTSAAARKFDHMSIEEYLHSNASGVEPWILELLNQAYIGEYGLETSKQSAINLLYLINPDTSAGFQMFGPSNECMRIHGGNSRIVEALVKALEQGQVKIHKGHRLAGIKTAGTGFECSFITTGTTRAVAAHQLVMAIPFTMLRQVEGIDSIGLSAVKVKAIQEFGYGTNGKIMLGFKEKTWRQPNGSNPKVLPSNGEAFTDGLPQAYWETSRLQKGNSGIITNFSGGKFGSQVSEKAIPTVLEDLNRLFPGVKDVYDGNHAIMRWADQPFVKASYACPLVGQYTTIYGSPGEPELNGRILFAGEICSIAFQGFMDGAVETGNLAAKAIIAQQ